MPLLPAIATEDADMTVREALRDAAQRLCAISETSRLDAELLMAFALGVEREAVLLNLDARDVPPDFDALVARRRQGEPIAYITGRRAFWTIELDVAPGVLIPRPDSETLIEAAVAHFGAGAPGRVLDLGTGSGALLLAALDQWPEAHGVGVDISGAALAIARRNAKRLGLADRADLRLGDWAKGLEACFDLILCNPPYIEEQAELPPDVREWEPHEALFAGKDGLDCYRLLAAQVGPLLSAGGVACIELGAGQAAAAAALFTGEGLKAGFRNDLSGHRRCLILHL